MSKVRDFHHVRIGKLTVLKQIGFTQPNKYGQRFAIWDCTCDCGNHVQKQSDLLGRGVRHHSLLSCGCTSKKGTPTHGMCNTGVYRSWGMMLNRCENPKDIHYKAYGGRGIKVCQEWHIAKNFIDWALSHGWKKGLTIERKDVNGDYCPENCCWIPMKEQYKNKQSNYMKRKIEPYKEANK